MSIRVIVADDYQLIRSGIISFLKQAPDIQVVAEAKTGQEAVALASKLKPDVLLLDYRFPDKKADEIIAELKSIISEVKILVFSGFAQRDIIQKVFDLGAAGYLTKDEPLEMLLEAIKGVANGEQGWLSRKIKGELMSIIQQKDDPDSKMSNRETDIVSKIAEGKTNRQIAYELHLSPKTVEKSVYRLYQKLGTRSRVELAIRHMKRRD